MKGKLNNKVINYETLKCRIVKLEMLLEVKGNLIQIYVPVDVTATEEIDGL